MEQFEDHEIQYAINCISKDIIVRLVEKEGFSIQDAMRLFIQSDTFLKLQNIRTGLVFQSYLYVYSFLENEMKTGISR